jgi:hypothetical protein
MKVKINVGPKETRKKGLYCDHFIRGVETRHKKSVQGPMMGIFAVNLLIRSVMRYFYVNF